MLTIPFHFTNLDNLLIEIKYKFIAMRLENNCSDPICGGRIYILKWVFFVQSILADRYIHRREIRVVSFINSTSVEFEIKFFSEFLYLSRSYRGLKFHVNTGY